jgi:hypothetical protein
MVLQRSRRFAVAAVLLLALCSPSVFAQVLEGSTRYRLERTSTFQRGCFPPCMCPIMQEVPVTGTFRLDLVAVGDVFDFYEVKNVRWSVPSNSGPLVITGSGTYKVSTIADLQEMALDLRVGSEPMTLYQSDTVAGGASFPRIALSISIHGGFCLDTVIDLAARPGKRFHLGPDGGAPEPGPLSGALDLDPAQDPDPSPR